MPKKNTEFNFSIKSTQEDGSFAGYASVFGIIDSQNDVVMRGAFTQSLKKRMHEVKLLWQHQMNNPIGIFTLIREDSHGLYVEGRLLLDLQQGAEAYSLLKNNAINGLSIGYTVVDTGYNGENNIRLITELDLWEVSLVTFPANEEAVVVRLKNQESRRLEFSKEEIGLSLRGVDHLGARRGNRSLTKKKEDGLLPRTTPSGFEGRSRNDDSSLLTSLDRAILALNVHL